MASTAFQVPIEFNLQLRLVDLPDKRPNQEIIKALEAFTGVTSEKNIWAFWDKGINRLPGWCQRNVCDWVRICGSTGWTIRVLDAVPDSPNYALKYVPADQLPQAFVEGTMTGPYVGPHSADFLRGALLHRYGGAFMDVGNMLYRNLDRVGWKELEDPASPYQISVPVMYGQFIANHFVMARKGDPFIRRWHELFVHFWKGRNNHKGIIQDPLLQFATRLDFTDSDAAKYNWDFKVEPQEIFEYVTQVTAWARLTMLEDTGDGFSGSDYWQNNVFTFDALQEDWLAHVIVGFKGEELYNTLSTRLNSDRASAEYKKAHNLVWPMLSKSTMLKITHAKGITHDKALGVYWDENDGKDIAPGTFAELLRYGATHFEQTREEIVRFEAKKAPETMKKGIFEP